MKLKLEQIIKDDDIYPRIQVSQKTIESYIEALKAGAKFPIITVQNISIDGKVKTISLDGWHRVEAYRAYNKIDGIKPIKEVEVQFWQDKTLDKSKCLVDLMIKSFELNAQQGLRPTQGDAKKHLEKIANTPDALNLVWKEIAKRFEVTPEWVSECVSPILAAKRMSRDAFIYRFHLLGWTQTEIGEVVGITQPEVSEIITKFNQFNSVIKSDFYEKRKKVEDIAEYYHFDIPLTWAILLEGKDDVERFKLFGDTRYGNEQPEMSDYWKFSERDPRLGQANYPGNLYGQEAMNIIYRFSRQGDLVIDPMAGGGTIIDACLILGRKCRAYDIEPTKSERHDIATHNALEPLQDRAKECQLVVLDPPYFKKKETEYGCDEFTKDRDTFLNNIKVVAQNCHNALKKGGYLALLYGQYLDYNDELASILSFDLATHVVEFNLRPVLSIQSPLTFNNQWHGDAIEKAKQNSPWKILPVAKDWLIFKKVLPSFESR